MYLLWYTPVHPDNENYLLNNNYPSNNSILDNNEISEDNNCPSDKSILDSKFPSNENQFECNKDSDESSDYRHPHNVFPFDNHDDAHSEHQYQRKYCIV